MFLFLSTAIAMSSSRGATIVLAVMVLGLAAETIFGRTLRWIYAILAIFSGFLVTLALQSPRNRNVFDDFAESPVLGDPRFSLLLEGIGNLGEIWRGRNLRDIIFGVGANQYRAHFELVFDPHNDFLTTLLERGLLGAALLGIPFYFLFHLVRRLSMPHKIFIAMFWLVLLLIGVAALTGFAQSVYLYFGILFGSYFQLNSREQQKAEDNSIGSDVKLGKT